MPPVGVAAETVTIVVTASSVTLGFGVCHLTLRSPPSCPQWRRHKEAPYVQRCDRGPTGAAAAAAAALQVGDKRTPPPAALYILQSW